MYPGSSSANQVAKNTATAKAEIFAEKTEFPAATPTPSTQMGKTLTLEDPAQLCRRHKPPVFPPLLIMESLCGLERGCYVQRGPTPRRGSHKYWQIDCHVTPQLFFFSPLLTRTNPLQNPLRLSQEGYVLDRRSSTLIYVLASHWANHLFYLPYLLIFTSAIPAGSSPGQ